MHNTLEQAMGEPLLAAQNIQVPFRSVTGRFLVAFTAWRAPSVFVAHRAEFTAWRKRMDCEEVEA